MIAILPIIINSEKDAWACPAGRDIILKAIQRGQEAEKIDRLIIFADQTWVLHAAKSMGTEAYLLEENEPSHSSIFLPAGSASAFQTLSEKLKLNFNKLIILSFRNPFLRASTIDQAVRRFGFSSSPIIVSVAKPIDHPVQFDIYYRVIDIGFIHLLENGKSVQKIRDTWCISNGRSSLISHSVPSKNTEVSYRITKPFYFDWRSRGVYAGDKGCVYVRQYNNFNVSYTPVETPGDQAIDERAQALWLYEGDCSARIMLADDLHKKIDGAVKGYDKTYRVIGVGFTGDYTYATAAVVSDRNGQKKYLPLFSIGPKNDEPYVLKLMPISMDGTYRQLTVEIKMEKPHQPVPIMIDCHRLCGLACVTLQTVQNGAYDLKEALPELDSIWDLNPDTAERINCRNGRKIAGRQDFPDVYIPDGSFFLIKNMCIYDFDQAVKKGNAEGFIIDTAQTMEIHTKLDLLRFKAIERAEHQSEV